MGMRSTCATSAKAALISSISISKRLDSCRRRSCDTVHAVAHGAQAAGAPLQQVSLRFSALGEWGRLPGLPAVRFALRFERQGPDRQLQGQRAWLPPCSAPCGAAAARRIVRAAFRLGTGGVAEVILAAILRWLRCGVEDLEGVDAIGLGGGIRAPENPHSTPDSCRVGCHSGTAAA